MSKFKKPLFFTVILNDKDSLVVSGVIPKTTKFPCLYLSDIENISNLEIKQHKGSELVKTYVFENASEITNIISFEKVKFEHTENNWYTAEYLLDKLDGTIVNVTKSTNKTEVIVSNEFPESEGSQLYVTTFENSNDEGDTHEYGSIGEYQIGSELHIRVKKPYFTTYLNSIHVKRGMDPIVPMLEREKGRCSVNLGPKALKLIEEGKAELRYKIDDNEEIPFNLETGFEYEYGTNVKIIFDFKTHRQDPITKYFEKINQKRIEFEVSDLMILPETFYIGFSAKFINPDTGQEVDSNIYGNLSESLNLQVSLDDGAWFKASIGKFLDIKKGTVMKYRAILDGFETVNGEETIEFDTEYEFEMYLRAYEVKFNLKPETSEVFVDGNRIENNSFTSRYKVKHELLVTPGPNEFNLREYRGELIAENDFIMDIELEPKEIELQIIDKETGKAITSGAIEIYTPEKEKLEYTPETLKTAKFLAGVPYEIHLVNKGFREYLLTKTFDMKSPNATVYKLEIPFWRKPRVTVVIKNKGEMRDLEILLINSEKKSIKLTSGASVETNAGEYTLKITAVDRNGKEQEPIIEKINVNDDYVGMFELVEKHKEPAMMIISAYPNNSVIEINGELTKTYNGYVGDTIHVKVVGGFNFVTFDADVTIDSTLVEKYIVLERTPWKFVVKPKDSDKDAEFTINGNAGLTYETLHQERIVIIGKLEGKHDWVYNKVIEKNTPLLVELVPEFIDLNEPLPEDQFLATIETLMKPKRFYNYLTIGRVFKTQGFNIKSIYTFYKKFGRYCSSKTDYKIYNICKTYFEANPQE